MYYNNLDNKAEFYKKNLLDILIKSQILLNNLIIIMKLYI